MSRHRLLASARPRWLVPAALAVLLAATLIMWRSCAAPPDGQVVAARTDETARALGRSFLDTYVDDQGRVLRRDEGSDVVSEGQAYGMLIATALGDESSFRRIWAWTKANLAQPDGLLAWRWLDGVVRDPNSASDADVDAARALALAGQQFGAVDLTADGEYLAQAVMRREAVPVDADGVLLVAGNWARSSPQDVNPSYFNPRGQRDLARLTVDRRWTTMSSTHRALVQRLLSTAALPPDWFEFDDGAITPTGHDSAPIQFGLDAARLPVRLAESCEPQDRQLAAGMRVILNSPTAIRHLDGTAATEWGHPMALVAAAAADHAAGADAAAADHLHSAADLDQRYPTYYGAAWVALGHIMLQTTLLGACDQ